MYVLEEEMAYKMLSYLELSQDNFKETSRNAVK